MKLFLVTMIMLIACNLLLCDIIYTPVYVDDDFTGDELGTISNPYSSIQSALMATRNEPVPYEIILNPGTYTGGVEFEGYQHPRRIRSLYSPGNEHFIAETIIQGDTSHPAISIRNCSNLSIIGLSLQNGHGYSETIDNHPAIYGGGISSKNVEILEISNCDISNNNAVAGAGIYLDVWLWGGARIVNTKIHHNTSPGLANNYECGGAGIFVKRGKVVIESSQIYSNICLQNYAQGGGISNSSSSQLYRACTSDITIDNTLIYNNELTEYGSGMFISFYLNDINNDYVKLTITNSNIVNNHNVYGINQWHAGAYLLLGDTGLPLNSETEFTITNSIFWGNKYGNNNIDNQLWIGYWNGNNATNPHPEWVKYNYIQRRIVNGQLVDNLNIDASNIGNQLIAPGISPHFTDPENYDFSLKWDTSIKSPCIDSGYPEQCDVLYDRPDIGAIEFNGFAHNTYTYTFPPRTTYHGIKWMSFPVLYDVENGQFINHIAAGDFFTQENILDPFILEQIEWNDINDIDNNEYDIQYLEPAWTELDHIITSMQGYKVQMDALNTVERTIEVSGFLQDVNAQVQLFGLHDEHYKENWLGYYYPKSQHVFDAFQEFIDELWYIQTQHWTLIRQYSELGGPWVGVLTPASKPLVLSPGDMVVVKSFRDFNYTWSDYGPEREPLPPLKAEHFAYLEKLEYIPILTDFRNSNLELPKEIAVYINGVCKGAAVVTDSLAQILAYICDDIPDNPELEFMLYYDNKSMGIISDYDVWNPGTNQFQSKKLVIDKKQDYYLVNITGNGQDNTPLPRLYLTNYPNPFSPVTNIKYYVPKDDDVKMGIYNSKGQLVKVLVDKRKTAGMQEITWDGTDAKGKSCAGGVYFCKMSFRDKNISKKLVLMK